MEYNYSARICGDFDENGCAKLYGILYTSDSLLPRLPLDLTVKKVGKEYYVYTHKLLLFIYNDDDYDSVPSRCVDGNIKLEDNCIMIINATNDKYKFHFRSGWVSVEFFCNANNL